MPVMDPIPVPTPDGEFRTSFLAVAGIIEVDGSIAPDATAMEPFILIANELVTEWCTGDNGPSNAYTDARLEVIERWLAAHFYTVRDPRAEMEKAGSVSAKYQSKVDLGFDTSHYGQTAMRLDTNGGLARLNQKVKKGQSQPTMLWLGTAVE